MAAGNLVHLFHRRPEGYVNVLARHMKLLPHEGHPVFPADQSTDAAHGCLDHPQPAPVSLSPDQAFIEGRDEFTMEIDEIALRTKCENCVVECATARSFADVFLYSYDQSQIVFASCFGQRFGYATRNNNAILQQLRVESLHR